MKLFRFNTNNFCRMYVMAKDKNRLLQMADELFEQYDFIDQEDFEEYKNGKYNEFMKGISKAKESTDNFFIDAHY